MTAPTEAQKAKSREVFLRVCDELHDNTEPVSPREQRYIDAYAQALADEAELAVRALFEETRFGGPWEPLTPVLRDPRAKTAVNANGQIIGDPFFGGWILNCDTGRWPLTIDDFVRMAINDAKDR